MTFSDRICCLFICDTGLDAHLWLCLRSKSSILACECLASINCTVLTGTGCPDMVHTSLPFSEHSSKNPWFPLLERHLRRNPHRGSINGNIRACVELLTLATSPSTRSRCSLSLKSFAMTLIMVTDRNRSLLNAKVSAHSSNIPVSSLSIRNRY